MKIALAEDQKAVRVSECGRELVEVSDEKSAIAALLAAVRWLNINEGEELKVCAALEALLEKETVVCPRCNGTGKIMHDAWRSFWERYGHLRGFELGAAMDEKGPKTPEEITCTKCGGSGRALTPQGEKIAEKVRALHEKLLDIEGWQ
jgi:hypothetical protein